MKLDFIIALIAFVSITLFIDVSYMRKISPSKSTKRKKKEAREIIEIRYLIISHNLKKEKLLNPKIILLISLIDALIITTVFLVIVLIPYSIIWQLMAGFVLLLGLIYSIYNILGMILYKKGYGEK
ncbi:MAG: hypothetical protein E7164_00825 [Firmicutes bacterium]|nr:hypothetical protein [Bacillota bacterium]